MKFKVILLIISLFLFAHKVNSNEKSKSYLDNTVVTVDLGHHDCGLIKSIDIKNNYLVKNGLDNKMYYCNVNTIHYSIEYIVNTTNSTLKEEITSIYRLKTIVLAGICNKVKFNTYLYHSTNKLGFT